MKPKALAYLGELRHALRRRIAAAEGQKDLERRGTCLFVELHAQRVDAVEMAGLLDGEGGAELTPADVHINRLRLDVEEFTGRAEATELPYHLARHAAVRDDDVDRAEPLQRPEELLPARHIQLDGAAVGKAADHLDF